jgi:hypothetical protein
MKNFMGSGREEWHTKARRHKGREREIASARVLRQFKNVHGTTFLCLSLKDRLGRGTRRVCYFPSVFAKELRRDKRG